MTAAIILAVIITAIGLGLCLILWAILHRAFEEYDRD
jgi:nitrogen fixation-related uncharacterized protein